MIVRDIEILMNPWDAQEGKINLLARCFVEDEGHTFLKRALLRFNHNEVLKALEPLIIDMATKHIEATNRAFNRMNA